MCFHEIFSYSDIFLNIQNIPPTLEENFLFSRTKSANMICYVIVSNKRFIFLKSNSIKRLIRMHANLACLDRKKDIGEASKQRAYSTNTYIIQEKLL